MPGKLRRCSDANTYPYLRRGALSDRDWPSASVVTNVFGTWAKARAAADHGASAREPAEVGDRYVAVGT
jgi:hypothetical protein